MREDRNVRAHKVLSICNLLTKLYGRESSKRFAYKLALDIEDKLCGVLDSVYEKVHSGLEMALWITDCLPKEDIVLLLNEVPSKEEIDRRLDMNEGIDPDERQRMVRSVGLNH